MKKCSICGGETYASDDGFMIICKECGMPQIGTYTPSESQQEQPGAFNASENGSFDNTYNEAEWENIWKRLAEDEEFRKVYEADEMYVPASISYDMLNKIFLLFFNLDQPFGCKKRFIVSTNHNQLVHTPDGIIMSRNGLVIIKAPSDITMFISPESVEIIDFFAFARCYELKSVALNKGLTTIDHASFEECYSLKSIHIPETVTSIGKKAFFNCGAVENVVMFDGLQSIEGMAFANCSKLKSVVIPKTVTRIGDAAFQNCFSIEEIFLPLANFEYLGKYIFASCSSLSRIVIPAKTVKEIPEGFLYKCSLLRDVTIPYDVKVIGEAAFSHCQGITSVNIPSGVEKISKEAFLGCTLINSITIPHTVKTVESFAFAACGLLSNVSIHSRNTIIDQTAFAECPLLQYINYPDTVQPVITVQHSESAKVPTVSSAETDKLYTPKELFERNLKSAEEGDHKAQFDLYKVYSEGTAVPQDNIKAMDYLKKSAEGGYGPALDKLGETEFGKFNYILASENWEKALKLGHCTHLLQLAYMYIDNSRYGMQPDLQHGVELIRKAAESGDTVAQYEMGKIYYEGKYVQHNATEAFNWMQKSAEAGDAQAQNELGNFYRKGTGCVMDPHRAVVWFEKSSYQGNTDGMWNYAERVYLGEGTMRDPRKAETLFKTLINKRGLKENNPEMYGAALFRLAMLNTRDFNNLFEAFNYWEKAAEMGDATAQYNLGMCYLKGSGTSIDIKKAKEWFTKSSKNGFKDAQTGLDLLRQAEELEEMKRRQQDVQEYAQRVQQRGCYVATAVYGSYDCPEVWVLRRFRDKKLSSTILGRAFIKVYYAISPTCVKYFGKTKLFNKLFRNILDKKVSELRSEGYSDTPYYDE